MNLKRIVIDYVHTGVKKTHSHEAKQQVYVANIFSFIGYTLTFFLGLSALIRSEFSLAIVLGSAASLFFISHLLLRLKYIPTPYKYSASLITISLFILMFYLIYSGGNNNTGPLWIYLVPPVALFFGGLKKGGIHIAIFVLIICFLLFYENGVFVEAQYSKEFKLRLIYSFLTVTCLFGFYEKMRQSSFKSLKKMSDKFESQAMHDQLSGLLNRRGMLEKLEQEFSRAKRANSVLTIMMCDIDHFKLINDEFGHTQGDEIIEHLAKEFKVNLRKQDAVARWGGEEYLFLLPDTQGEDALVIAEKLRKKIAAASFTHQDKQFNVTISIGVHQATLEDSINQAISKADKCLYHAKLGGRNRCTLS
ncbi:diguanylate cyclase [Paraglaciecola sp. 2405UD69-4]|uniref:GGDEF domain-containing protein n=1 Tax=Paraglaciecola sp. 2405UD69-4 TaxID=3391836 RepID=UPI0039C9526F